MTKISELNGQMLQFSIEDGATAWPKVYGTSQVHPDARPTHMLAIPAAMIPPDLLPYLHVSEQHNVVTASSHRPPTVCTFSDTDADLDHLARMLQRLDAQNRPRDDVFAGRNIIVTVEVYVFPADVRRGRQSPPAKLFLRDVRVDLS